MSHRLGLERGDVLLASLKGDRLVLEPPGGVRARLRERLAVVPKDVSLVDELMAERREEARRESAG
jgi:bifunctional DNA-binding transcriptional regulator/antitoxin component of YhaV-PrlF toxin-antitoxin module